MAVESPPAIAEHRLNVLPEVFMRAGDRCEYCHLPQWAYKRRYHLEHITARCYGGTEDFSNLALACGGCNLRKGINLAGIDPRMGDVAALFHPRKDAGARSF